MSFTINPQFIATVVNAHKLHLAKYVHPDSPIKFGLTIYVSGIGKTSVQAENLLLDQLRDLGGELEVRR
ncbi:hypothetical protein [Nakamurella sp. PAMC28650]|uniref:hypothetical protein n=1 Tax=Nakamurella sp. PAMC28650 TaxID=2762325 RepID=UPI00164D9E38|nr:hypothetical protein [Nakamurella sp. PAMC28650]QNK82569.1 hypothetical protein H7F38_07645 [Nakamurella sp. PAMC28650]